MTVFWPLQRVASSARRGGIFTLAVLVCLTASPVAAQGAKRSTAASPPVQSAATPNPLRDLSASVEQLAERVSRSVVQVLVTGYGPVDDGSRGETGLVIARQRSIGSGATTSGEIIVARSMSRGLSVAGKRRMPAR